MKKFTLLAALLLATGAVTVQAAELVLYDNPGLNGRQLTVRGYMPDIATYGFNDRASSVAVHSGTWEVCTDAQFRGFCATLQPGEYRMLDPRFNNRISSAREVGVNMVETAPPPRLVEVAPPAYEPRGPIEMYAQTGYRGRTLLLDHSARNLRDLGFNDRTTSLIVREGAWELCSDSGFRGSCRVFEPGSYADIGPGLAREVSSARLIRSAGQPLYQTGVNPPLVARPGIELFEGLNFDGYRYSAVRDAPSLERRGFNDRAGSMIIYEGQWEACTDARYNGHCQVFGPGRYADLARFNGEVSSVRRIN